MTPDPDTFARRVAGALFLCAFFLGLAAVWSSHQIQSMKFFESALLCLGGAMVITVALELREE
jgi:hypothetical protein